MNRSTTIRDNNSTISFLSLSHFLSSIIIYQSIEFVHLFVCDIVCVLSLSFSFSISYLSFFFMIAICYFHQYVVVVVVVSFYGNSGSGGVWLVCYHLDCN